MTTVVGIDIGGANLKVSDGDRSLSQPFELWRHADRLDAALHDLISQFPAYDSVAVTMTGELVDCFKTRRDGVQHILNAVAEVVPPQKILVWQTGGEFVTIAEANELTELVAAANWHALATWAGRSAGGQDALLIDLGSTTTDLTPIQQGLPHTAGLNDLERLQNNELIYSGARRTPICAIAQTVSLDGHQTPLAAELFATTLDIALILSDIDDAPDDADTANHQPATRDAALTRLARCLCSDCDQLSTETLVAVAHQLRDQQLAVLSDSLKKVLRRANFDPQIVITAGEGEYLLDALLTLIGPPLTELPRLSLSAAIGPQHSQAACAYALSFLGVEMLIA